MAIPSLVEVLLLEGSLFVIGAVVGLRRSKHNHSLHRHRPPILFTIPLGLFAVVSLPAALDPTNAEWTLFHWIRGVFAVGVLSILLLWSPYVMGSLMSYHVLEWLTPDPDRHADWIIGIAFANLRTFRQRED